MATNGGFTPEFMEELKYKCDIVEIVSQYVPLVKKGSRYFGRCPFHNEKTPSMCVNQQSGFYHCFGCGKSGDVIDFVMEEESMSFFDAVKYLAEKAGMPLPELKMDPDYNKKKERSVILKQLMRDAARYYRNNLLDEEKGRAAREYLAGRGINDATSLRYGLGLSLDFDSMPSYLRRKEYTLKDLYDCGLIGSVEHPSDAFAGRIIVPILNGMDEVVAFGGRIYNVEKDDNTPKYKNSTNTQLFDKGRTLYGLNKIKADRRKGAKYDNIILVEGYMDVIALGAAGVNNAVAGMGTALTDGQARELHRYTADIITCYDGDGAGRAASLKNLSTLLGAGLNVKVASLDDGKDPDETVRFDGREAFDKKIAEALPAIEYRLKTCENGLDLKSVNGRARYASLALRVLADIDNLAEREVYASVVSNKSGVSVETIKQQLAAERTAKKAPARSPEPSGDAARPVRAARFVLNRIMENAEYADIDALREEWFALPKHCEIARFAKGQPKGEFNVGKMFVYVENDDEVNRILNIDCALFEGEGEKNYYDACLKILADDYLSRSINELKEKYASQSDPNERKATLTAISGLTKKLKSKNLNDKY